MDRIAALRALLDTEVPDTVGGVSLLVVAAVVATWGILAIVEAYRTCGRRDAPRWHPRRWVAPCFGYFLGWFLIVSDASLYAIIGIRVLASPEGLSLVWVCYLAACGVSATVAFVYWARGHLPKRGGR
ncbi:MAG: hypothetical protein M3Q74_13210 [Pseudomonadota bacterium]|nr:hypothetical protein [Pseudomonadota bacterium]